mmetsp:Transcript_11312/g.42240  ORF Transcript_11312/g.42240 Transcript_11312/m.42240 type:complete len:238 (+) Transcript_11312:2713-3426(+)
MVKVPPQRHVAAYVGTSEAFRRCAGRPTSLLLAHVGLLALLLRIACGAALLALKLLPLVRVASKQLRIHQFAGRNLLSRLRVELGGQLCPVAPSVEIPVVLRAPLVRLGLHLLRDVLPVAQAGLLDGVQQQELLMRGPVFREDREAQVGAHTVLVPRAVLFDAHTDAKAKHAELLVAVFLRTRDAAGARQVPPTIAALLQARDRDCGAHGVQTRSSVKWHSPDVFRWLDGSGLAALG